MVCNAAATIVTGLPSALMLGAAQHHTHASTWLWICLWAYLLHTRIWATFIPHLRLAYSWDDEEMSIVEGIISTSTKHVPWESIASVRTSQPWQHRALNCYRVDVFSSGSHDAHFTLEAVTSAEATAIEEQFMAHRKDRAPGPTASAPELPSDGGAPALAPETLYRMSTSGIFMTGFSYGQFVLAIPTTAQLVSAAREKSLSSTQSIDLVGLPLSGWRAWFLFIALALGVGAVISLLKYANFTVVRHPRGLETTRGSIERRRHLHSHDSVSGFLVSQNLLMQLFGRYRLDVLSRADQRRELSGCLLPCARRSTVCATIRVLNPCGDPALRGGISGRLPGARRKVAFIGAPLGLALTVLAGAAFYVDAWICAAAALVATLVSNTRFGECAPPTTTDGVFVVRHRLLAPRWYLTSRVAGIETLSSPLSRRCGLTHLKVHAYAGHHVIFRTLLERPHVPHALATVRDPHHELTEEEA